MINTILFGSSSYCLPVIESLHRNFNLKLIITRPDKPTGRSKIITPSHPKQFALKNNIPLITPISLISPSVKSSILQTHPTIAIVADYGLMIPKEIFTIPAYQTLNIHFSRLPQYKGSSPVQYTILNGDRNSWITIHLLEEKLDSGPIIWQKEYKLNGNETTGSLYKKLFKETAKQIPQIIPDYISGKLSKTPQASSSSDVGTALIGQWNDGNLPTHHISKQDAFIPWPLLKIILNSSDLSDFPNFPNIPDSTNLSPLLKSILTQSPQLPLYSLFERASRAFSPWPLLWTKVKIKGRDRRLKILSLSIPNSPNHPNITLHKVQLEGKSEVTWKQFLQGYPEVAEEFEL